jgi:hypothetical protein
MPYKFTTIGDNADLTFNQLLGVNNAGEIAGYFGSGGDATHPNRGYTVTLPYGQNQFTNENFFGSAQTQVTGLDSFGLTVGFEVDQAGNNLGFVVNPGAISTLVTDPNLPAGSVAAGTAFEQLLGVNDTGTAVGFYNDANGNAHGFEYDIATQAFTEIDVAGATDTTVTGINNAGVLSGVDVIGGVTEGFIDNAGTITQLTGPSGTTSLQALGLNNEGQVVGDYVDAAGNMHGFVYSIGAASYTTVDDPNQGTVGGVTSTTVNGINDQGQLVGFYIDANGNTDGMLATVQGVVATVTNPTAGSVLRAAQGSGGVAAGGSNAVTLVDNTVGNVDLFANAGNDTLVASAAGDTLVGGPGNDTFFAGSGSINPGSVTAFGGSGSSTFVGGEASTTFIGGSGTSLAFSGSGGGLLWGGSGSGSYVGANDSATTIVAGLGASNVYAGSGNAVFLTGSANDVVEYTGAAGGNTTLVGTGSSGSNLFVAGSGNDQVDLGSGSNIAFLGSGNSNFTDGSGADLFELINGQLGGSDIINDFKVGTDKLQLYGFGANEVQNDLANATVANGSTQLTLSDGTRLDFVGVTNLTAHSFV